MRPAGEKINLTQLITDLKLDKVWWDDFTQTNFPSLIPFPLPSLVFKCRGFEPQPTWPSTLILPATAIAQMEQQGYRPARLYELLIWAKTHWLPVRGQAVVALGESYVTQHGHWLFPALGYYGDQTSLTGEAGAFPVATIQFLGVQLSSLPAEAKRLE